MGGGLLPECLVECVAGGAEEELALAVAVAHDRSKIVVDDVDGGEVGALGDFGPLRDDVVDGGAFGYSAGPLGVDVGFSFVARDAGVGAVVDDVEVLRAGGRSGVAERQVEELAEVDEVGGVDVGLADDGDSLAGAVDGSCCVPEWEDVVNGGEVVWGDAVGGFAAAIEGEGGVGGKLSLVCLVRETRVSVGGRVVVEVACLVAGRATGEVVEGRDARDDRRKGRRDGGIGCVGEVLLAPDSVEVHAGSEGTVDRAGGSAEVDEGTGGVDPDAGEAMAGEPGGDDGKIAISGSEGSAEGLGREPLVIGG